jgi:hypothetical protein
MDEDEGDEHCGGNRFNDLSREGSCKYDRAGCPDDLCRGRMSESCAENNH